MAGALGFVARGIRDPQLIVGAGAGMRATEGLLRGATESMTLEAFRMSDTRIVEAVSDRLAAKVDVHVLADPEEWARDGISRARLEPEGAHFERFGNVPDKLHSKSAVVDHDRAVITTSAWVDAMRDGWVDLSVFFRGDAARALEHLTKVSGTGDKAAIRSAAVEAARHGVLLNDIANGVDVLHTQLLTMINGAERDLTVVTKRYEDPGMMAAIEAARDRGVKVTVEARSKPWHANVVIADDQAYVGTAHITKRSMVGGGSNGRRSREIGVLIDDAATLVQLREAVAPGAALPVAERVAGAVDHVAPRGSRRRTALIAGGAVAGVGAAGAGALYLTNRR